MGNNLNNVLSLIESLNPVHIKKIRKNVASFDSEYELMAELFFKKYFKFLKNEDKSINFAIDCYLKLIADVYSETIEFHRTGKYSSTTFEEVNERVYANPNVMEYYMHGLIMSQFLWKQHYFIYKFYTKNLIKYIDQTKKFLEIGAGHGLYLSKALDILSPTTSFDVVDISETSISIGKKFCNDDRVDFKLQDIFNFPSDVKFDFITMGEVLEHVEQPKALLSKIRELMDESSTLFMTTPTNAPAIDHLYLFNNVEEIREFIFSTGFEIIEELAVLTEDVSEEKAKKNKVSILYGAFLKLNNSI
jgi:2-polyprenyl-3-methyl-5-hydroxy-6-metoxy-1,4-benzoquinol methylase